MRAGPAPGHRWRPVTRHVRHFLPSRTRDSPVTQCDPPAASRAGGCVPSSIRHRDKFGTPEDSKRFVRSVARASSTREMLRGVVVLRDTTICIFEEYSASTQGDERHGVWKGKCVDGPFPRGLVVVVDIDCSPLAALHPSLGFYHIPLPENHGQSSILSTSLARPPCPARVHVSLVPSPALRTLCVPSAPPCDQWRRLWSPRRGGRGRGGRRGGCRGGA